MSGTRTRRWDGPGPPFSGIGFLQISYSYCTTPAQQLQPLLYIVIFWNLISSENGWNKADSAGGIQMERG